MMAVNQRIVLLLILYVSSVHTTITVSLSGNNVYSVPYKGLQYFLFMKDIEATISCRVSGTSTVPNISFRKEGKELNTVLPESMYLLETESSDDGQSHTLRLKIDSSGYTDIIGDWTCEVGGIAQPATKPFKTLCASKPTIEFKPPLVEGVAREGTTITMNCDCGELKEFEGDITWNWLIDNGSPPASKIRYEGPGSEEGYPSKTLVISNIDALDSEAYRCTCLVGQNIQIQSHEVSMKVMKPPGIPEGIAMYKASTMDTLHVKWNSSESMGDVTGFQISYKEKDHTAYKEVSSNDASVTRYQLKNLTPMTEYDVKIAAFNNAGIGEYSDVVTFSTSQPSESVPRIISPSYYVSDEHGNLVVDVGEDVDISLPCQVTSNPGSLIKWYFNGKEISSVAHQNNLPNNYALSLPYDRAEFTTEVMLTVSQSKATNQGRYTCSAINAKGKASQSYFVRVTVNEEQTSGNSSSATLLSTSLHTVLLVTFIRTALIS